MYECRNLSNIDIEIIRSTFEDAFSNYEVKVEMPLEKLKEMMKTRDYRAELSFGCFDGKELVGVSLTGYREINRKKYCYDTGTGIRVKYQNRKIGSLIIKELISYLKSYDIDYFQLEVLVNNLPAQKIYLNNGFEVTRKLNCYELSGRIADIDTSGYSFSDSADYLEKLDEEKYCSYQPSWQNCLTAYFNSKDVHEVFIIPGKRSIAAYAIVHRVNGSILQLGVEESERDNGLERILLGKIHSVLKKERYSVSNVEDESYMDGKLKELGFVNSISQYEMILEMK